VLTISDFFVTVIPIHERKAIMSDEINQKNRERSKAYPGANLEDCVQMTLKIKRNLGSGRHDRESLATAMGYAGVSGAVSPKIAALVYFGFLEKKGNEYWLSEESRRVTDPLTEDEKREELQAALKRPDLYQDLIAKFEPDGRIPEQLPIHLHRFHGIADNAAVRAAAIFRQSAVYAGILNEEGRFCLANRADIPPQQIKPPSIPAVPNSSTGTVPQADNKPPSEEHRSKTARYYAFPLSGGRAELNLPEKLSRKDIDILKKQIEILELEVE